MLTANKEKLYSFFISSNQFIIPFFQRAYVWKQENWNDLWEDILEELVEQKAGNHSEHFIGTIIVKHKDTGKLGSLVYDLIDGQQRLTTVCLLLKALHDASDDTHLKKWINDLLIFSDSYGNKDIRLIHSKVDAEYFQQIIRSENDNETLPSTKNKIVEAYIFYRKKIVETIIQDEIRDVVNILLEKLPVIHMALAADDDVQQIFDTINSLGVKLTTGELLKNHLFSQPKLTEHYDTYWKNIFEYDEESMGFWDANKTSGRIIRTTIELFLYSYLVIITESNVKLEYLFKEFKKHLKDKSADFLLLFAKELSEYAKIYEQFPDGNELSDISFGDHEKRFFHVAKELDVNTIFPLLLYIYKRVQDELERTKILACLESFLVRRTVCKLSTKNYGNLFISIMVDLKKHDELNADIFLAKLRSYSDESNRFPTDEEFKRGFSNTHLINKYTKEVLYCIALYQHSHEYQDNKRLSNEAMSVEHMMPKNWRKHWQLPANSPKKDEEYRDSKLLTLGNLTLIKGRLNSSLRDSSWVKKQKGLQPFSTLAMTRKYLDLGNWDESTISARADDLYKIASAVWTLEVPKDIVVENKSVEKKPITITTGKKASSPSAVGWVVTIPELAVVNGLNSWVEICDHLNIPVEGDSGRRRLKKWVEMNKPDWAPVPDV